MKHKSYSCTVTGLHHVSHDLVAVRFKAKRKLRFAGGQFFSLYIPEADVFRLYSFSSPPEHHECEFLIRIVPGGTASSYVSKLRVGDSILIRAAYGDFVLGEPSDRNLFFITTGSGIGSARSILLSREMSRLTGKKFGLFGFRNINELCYQDDFKKTDFHFQYCVSKFAGSPTEDVFNGRVSEYLKAMPSEFPWKDTEYYLCGNGEMVTEVAQHLIEVRGVPAHQIHKEAFTPSFHTVRAASQAA